MFVNLKPLLGIPNIAGLLEKQRANPLAALTFAGLAESVRNSNWLNLELNVEGQTLALRALTDGKITGPTNPAAFALPQKAGDGARPNLAVPRRIAALSLYRDLHGFYAAKDTLFPERTSGLIFFENMMGIFFTGRDLTERGPGRNRARGSDRGRPAAVRCFRRDAGGPGPGVCRGAAAAPPGAVRQGRRGGLAKGGGPDQLHARPEGACRD